MKNTIFFGLLMLLISGCSSFAIYDKNNVKKPGVPFYLKTAQVKQVTQYTRSWIDINIEFKQLDLDAAVIKHSKKSAQFSISKASFDQPRLMYVLSKAESMNDFSQIVAFVQQTLVEDCKQGTNCVIPVQSLLDESLPSSTHSALLSQTLVSNSASYDERVDYENPYYFNANMPLFGTTTATVKLAADGTLTEGSSTIDNTKLADSIPLKELLLKKWALLGGGSNPLEMHSGNNRHVLELSVATNGYQYTLSKIHPLSAGLNLSPLTFNESGVSMSKVAFSAQPPKKKEQKNTIKFDGAIVLPK